MIQARRIGFPRYRGLKDMVNILKARGAEKKVLHDKKNSKSVKTANGSALSQRAS